MVIRTRTNGNVTAGDEEVHQITLEDHVAESATLSPPGTSPDDATTSQQRPATATTATSSKARPQTGRTHSPSHKSPSSSTTRLPDTEIDILYENQRGSFFCGIPLFSSRSLLNFDPAAWVTSEYHPSAVDITNAQVPDPGWEWRWRSWYVDMGPDVDEEGWQYSINFRGFAWHGSHPWFHSFVRRRRWLRQRGKRKGHRRGPSMASKYGGSQSGVMSPMTESVDMAKSRDFESLGNTLVSSRFARSSWYRSEKSVNFEDGDELGEIKDVPTLLRYLRQTSIDREKIVVVKKFIEEGDEELFYLAENMEQIMSLFVFQSSRRQLLATITAAIDEREDAMEQDNEKETAPSSSDGAGDDHSPVRRRTRSENLRSAASAADEQVRRLEFWSDIKDVVRDGEAPLATGGHGDKGKGKWAREEWEGVDQSGAAHP